jgi:DNA-binding transcriptional ArsR family regulator
MKNIEDLAEIFKALSDPTRLKLLRLLTQHQFLCVNALTKQLHVTQSAVSQHLRTLRQVGLVTAERKGYHIHYSLNHDLLKQYKAKLLETFGEEFVVMK